VSTAAAETDSIPEVHTGERPHPHDIFYVKIALALAAMTGLEVSTYFADFGGFQLPVLLILMAVKFVMVVLFFMHLRFDSPIFGRLFWTGLILAVLVYIAALSTFHFWSS
jgi:cytochrome c oxidase subunit 4